MTKTPGAGGAILAAVLLFACCGLALAALRVAASALMLLVPAYAVITICARGAWRDHPRVLVSVEALHLGLVVCWLGLFATTESWFVSGPDSAVWPDYHPAVRGGFPWRGVLGHGGGGAPDFVPLDKGLVAVFVNLTASTVAAWLALLAVPARWLQRLHLPLAFTATVTSACAARYFVYYFD